MNYAFKMMAVVLALGVMVLQGCQTTRYSTTKSFDYLNNTSDKQAVEYACSSTFENLTSRYVYQKLIAKRGLDCSYGKSNKKVVDSKSNLNNSVRNYTRGTNNNYYVSIANDKTLCNKATLFGQWETQYQYIPYVKEAKRRGLNCGIGSDNKKNNQNITIYKHKDRFLKADNNTVCKYFNDFEWKLEAKRRGLDCGVNNKIYEASNSSVFKRFDRNNIGKIIQDKINNQKISDKSNFEICNYAIKNKNWDYEYSPYVEEAKKRGLDCGVKDNKSVIASKPKTKTYIQPKPSISSAELDSANKRALELERKLVSLQSKQKQKQLRINTDNQIPTISAFTKQNGSNAIISGRVTDNTEVAEVLIDGQAQQLNSNGTFKTNFYIPRTGKIIEIVAFDTKGNKASKLLKIERGNIEQASGPVFDRLNPSLKTVKSNPNALALIIGVADYEKTNADAIYADKDAQQFYDYATMKLGIPSGNIKELVNDKADLGEILINVKEWLRRSAKPNKSDIYIYFAGHGLASQDGTKMYLLPYDGRPRLLENTALLRDELFKDIKQANPRSVTVFLDTCYSGVTRNEEMLVAGRPIMIKAKEQSIPDGFTLFSAASNEQISRPLEEAKHGMFSYFLMKGMEGDADTNNDNKITARELHAYVEQNVVQQSSGSQTPELQGDKDRVLVQFN